MRFLISLLLTLLPTATLANGCEDLWFTRNLVMDRAGYCFGSTLGQELFDNADCTGKEVSISPADRALVDTIRQIERTHGCSVNTKAAWLDLPDAGIRRALDLLPVRDEFESACLNWLGAPYGLLSAPGGRPVGAIQPGDHVSFAHLPQNGWTYVTAHTRNGGLKSGGWMDTRAIEPNCRDFAG